MEATQKRTCFVINIDINLFAEHFRNLESLFW